MERDVLQLLRRQAEDASVNDQRNKEYGKFVQSFFDPLGISQAGNMDNGTSNRARLEFANEALDRAQVKVNDLTGQMKMELTALQVATDKYTAAAIRHAAAELGGGEAEVCLEGREHCVDHLAVCVVECESDPEVRD